MKNTPFKRRGARNVLLPIALLILVAFTVLSVNRYLENNNKTSSIDPVTDLTRSDKRSFASFKGFSLTERINNKISLNIKAKEAHIRNRKIGFFRLALQKVSELEDVTISLYDENEKIVSISSDYATMNAEKNVFFEGNVKCRLKHGDVFEVEKIFWDSKKSILRTKDSYVFTDKNGSVKKGKGFQYDIKQASIMFMPDLRALPKRRNM